MKTDEYGHMVDFDTETLNTLFNLYRIKRRFDDGIATRQEIKEALDASCNLWDFLIVDAKRRWGASRLKTAGIRSVQVTLTWERGSSALAMLRTIVRMCASASLSSGICG